MGCIQTLDVFSFTDGYRFEDPANFAHIGYDMGGANW